MTQCLINKRLSCSRKAIEENRHGHGQYDGSCHTTNDRELRDQKEMFDQSDCGSICLANQIVVRFVYFV